MHRTEADGSTVDHKYTEGNAALAIPATVVDAAAMNALQEEMCLTIERYGITLLTPGTDTYNQIYQALEIMHRRGGRPSPIIFTVPNNQASAIDVTNFPNFDTTLVLGVEFLFRVMRKTDTNNSMEQGRAYLAWNTSTLAWEVSIISGFAGGGVTFSTALVSGTNYKLQMVSDNIAGSSYTGALRITDITEIRVA